MTRILSIALLVLVAACNPYDPDLGYEPFQCGDSEPRCPLGYTCVTFAGGEALCQKTDGEVPDAGGGGGGGGGLTCNDDGVLEPNNSLGQAFDTGIPNIRREFSVVGLAICPETDIDLFKFEVAASGTDAVVEIEYRPERGELLLDVLNMSGASISSGQPPDDAPGTLRVEIANLPTGIYYAQIKPTAGVQNNYDSLLIATTGP
jgi:hypothetical protein